MLCGWIMSICAHGLLGPLSMSSRPLDAKASMSLTLLATPLLGASAAALIVPSLPDMTEGLHPHDEAGKATVCAAWNGIYSFGSALGPVFSSSLYAQIGFSGTCACLMAIGGAAAVFVGVRTRADAISITKVRTLMTPLQPVTWECSKMGPSLCVNDLRSSDQGR